MDKMFTYTGKRLMTWNVFTGCAHRCVYCYSERLIRTRLKDSPKYKECGFNPTFHPNEMNKTFKPNEFVFISSMGDIRFASEEIINQILAKVAKFPKTNFLFCTKDPIIYHFYPSTLNNIYFGVTLETNRDTKRYSLAPSPKLRYSMMKELIPCKKFVSIEPVMDFDLDVFSKWILDINPKIVEIGADNYNHGLPEPSGDKVKSLIKIMEDSGIEVICKDGLHRLLKDGK